MEVKTMKLYKETVRYDVRLPRQVIEVVDSESKRTGIQRAVFLRSTILNWIAKEHGALPDVNLPGLDQAALQHTPNGVAANES
jgi:hypothetical protein